MILEFFAEGIPKGQPRPRAFARNGLVRLYDPGTAEAWKGAVALAAKPHRPAEPFSEAVSVRMTFFMPRPKRLQTKKAPQGAICHTGKPDIDNLAKGVFDALTQIGVWRDDDQIASVVASKVFCPIGGRPGAQIRISGPWEPQAVPLPDVPLSAAQNQNPIQNL